MTGPRLPSDTETVCAIVSSSGRCLAATQFSHNQLNQTREHTSASASSSASAAVSQLDIPSLTPLFLTLSHAFSISSEACAKPQSPVVFSFFSHQVLLLRGSHSCLLLISAIIPAATMRLHSYTLQSAIHNMFTPLLSSIQSQEEKDNEIQRNENTIHSQLAYKPFISAAPSISSPSEANGRSLQFLQSWLSRAVSTVLACTDAAGSFLAPLLTRSPLLTTSQCVQVVLVDVDRSEVLIQSAIKDLSCSLLSFMSPSHTNLFQRLVTQAKSLTTKQQTNEKANKEIERSDCMKEDAAKKEAESLLPADHSMNSFAATCALFFPQSHPQLLVTVSLLPFALPFSLTLFSYFISSDMGNSALPVRQAETASGQKGGFSRVTDLHSIPIHSARSSLPTSSLSPTPDISRELFHYASVLTLKLTKAFTYTSDEQDLQETHPSNPVNQGMKTAEAERECTGNSLLDSLSPPDDAIVTSRPNNYESMLVQPNGDNNNQDTLSGHLIAAAVPLSDHEPIDERKQVDLAKFPTHLDTPTPGLDQIGLFTTIDTNASPPLPASEEVAATSNQLVLENVQESSLTVLKQFSAITDPSSSIPFVVDSELGEQTSQTQSLELAASASSPLGLSSLPSDTYHSSTCLSFAFQTQTVDATTQGGTQSMSNLPPLVSVHPVLSPDVTGVPAAPELQREASPPSLDLVEDSVGPVPIFTKKNTRRVNSTSIPSFSVSLSSLLAPPDVDSSSPPLTAASAMSYSTGFASPSAINTSRSISPTPTPRLDLDAAASLSRSVVAVVTKQPNQSKSPLNTAAKMLSNRGAAIAVAPAKNHSRTNKSPLHSPLLSSPSPPRPPLSPQPPRASKSATLKPSQHSARIKRVEQLARKHALPKQELLPSQPAPSVPPLQDTSVHQLPRLV